jgi:hypothetical protein
MCLNTKWWITLDRNNEYFNFIESRRKIRLGNQEKHEHHIIPRHWFNDTPEEQAYCNSKENLIYLSIPDHIKAHQLLFKIYARPGDEAAVYMLQGSTAESRRICREMGAKALHEKKKKEKSGFWNSQFQKEMATRSLNLPNALEIRSEGGRKGGHTRNLDRVIKEDDCYIFFFKSEPVLCIFNCRTGGEVLMQLNEVEKTKLTRVTSLLNGSRKSAYGWSCQKIEI